MAPRAQFFSKPYFLLLEVSLRAQDVKVLKEYFILTVYTFFLFFKFPSPLCFCLAAMTLLMGGFKWVEVGGSLGFFFPSIDWSRKYKDSMNWVCAFFLIPVIQFTEIVLRVLWLVEAYQKTSKDFSDRLALFFLTTEDIACVPSF